MSCAHRACALPCAQAPAASPPPPPGPHGTLDPDVLAWRAAWSGPGPGAQGGRAGRLVDGPVFSRCSSRRSSARSCCRSSRWRRSCWRSARAPSSSSRRRTVCARPGGGGAGTASGPRFPACGVLLQHRDWEHPEHVVCLPRLLGVVPSSPSVRAGTGGRLRFSEVRVAASVQCPGEALRPGALANTPPARALPGLTGAVSRPQRCWTRTRTSEWTRRPCGSLRRWAFPRAGPRRPSG